VLGFSGLPFRTSVCDGTKRLKLSRREAEYGLFGPEDGTGVEIVEMQPIAGSMDMGPGWTNCGSRVLNLQRHAELCLAAPDSTKDVSKQACPAMSLDACRLTPMFRCALLSMLSETHGFCE